MKRFLLLYTFLLTAFALSAQIHDPVKWTFDSKTQSENTVSLQFNAVIENGWHIYSTELPQAALDEGIRATKVVFEMLENAELSGSLSTSNSPVEKYDNNVLMNLSYYENAVRFTQKIRLKDSNNYHVAGYVEFMACTDEMCIAPKRVPFEFALKTAVSENPPFIANEPQDSMPVDTAAAQIVPDAESVIDLWQPVSAEFTEKKSSDASLWWVFAMGLVGGLLALLTPCVWPIIPMTVSFFLKRNQDKKRGRRDAVLYALAIVIIYVGLGLLITVVFGASALNELSTNAIFNIFLFLLLVVFAVSFFGAFEITLPASWVNRMNRKAETTAGFVSILFMAWD